MHDFIKTSEKKKMKKKKLGSLKFLRQTSMQSLAYAKCMKGLTLASKNFFNLQRAN